jgi:hypothetical protein
MSCNTPSTALISRAVTYCFPESRKLIPDMAQIWDQALTAVREMPKLRRLSWTEPNLSLVHIQEYLRGCTKTLRATISCRGLDAFSVESAPGSLPCLEAKVSITVKFTSLSQPIDSRRFPATTMHPGALRARKINASEASRGGG